MSNSKKSTNKQNIVHAPNQITFGFDRQTDETSLLLFLQTFSSYKLLDVLIPRLDETEITETVMYVTSLMKKHLSEKEYHQLFLANENK